MKNPLNFENLEKTLHLEHFTLGLVSQFSSVKMAAKFEILSLYSQQRHNYFCTQCKKCFKSVGSLKTHMISHMMLPNFSSSHLTNTQKNKNKWPQMSSTNNNEVPESIAKGVFTCRICSTAHVTWHEFSKHFLKNHGVEPKILLQYKCVPCDLLFQSKQVYLEHNTKCPKQQQNNFNATNNSQISINLQNSNSVTSSDAWHYPTDLKKHVCTICLRAFKRSDNLKAHARTVHYGLKANNCNSCGKGYRTKNELLKHLSKNCPFRTELTLGLKQDEFHLDSLLL